MGFNSNGQIQYLVLDSLSSGSKYGLEIIEYISQKTGGNYIMKKPTLYSCLTRMEKKGLVSSSYWGDSEFGGKRHYYTITNQGKKNLEELSPEFSDASFINDENENESNSKVISSQTKETYSKTDLENKNENSSSLQKPVFLQQDNIFDIVKNQSNKQNTTSAPSNEENEEIIENQIDFFSYQPQKNNNTLVDININKIDDDTQQIQDEFNENTDELDQEKMEYYKNILEQENLPAKLEENKDDARFLDEQEHNTLTSYQEEQNRKLYDTSNELKKYRKKKSFSENQIEMSVVYEKEEDTEIQKSRIEQLKQSMLSARQNTYENITNNTYIKKEEPKFDDRNSKENELIYKKEYTDENVNLLEEKDDATFITNPPIKDNEIPVQRKITPPNIEVNIYDDNLPAPKRNSNLEPTYKDMMAKLFERKKEKSKNMYVEKQDESVSFAENNSFADYDNLKKYYNNHGIDFKEYKKTTVERRHNTNLLVFINSVILFLLSGLCCGTIFGIVNALNLIKTETLFMYYTIPVLFFVYGIYTFVKFKAYPSKKANIVYNSIINWAVFILASLVVFVINIACGMQYETVNQFLTPLILPIIALFIAFPVNYYIKKIIYKKYSK